MFILINSFVWLNFLSIFVDRWWLINLKVLSFDEDAIGWYTRTCIQNDDITNYDIPLTDASCGSEFASDDRYFFFFYVHGKFNVLVILQVITCCDDGNQEKCHNDD